MQEAPGVQRANDSMRTLGRHYTNRRNLQPEVGVEVGVEGEAQVRPLLQLVPGLPRSSLTRQNKSVKRPFDPMGLTWEQTALASRTSTRPPTLVNLLDILDYLTFH